MFQASHVILLAEKRGNWRRARLCRSLGTDPQEEWSMAQQRVAGCLRE
jgi:hypothetical protein